MTDQQIITAFVKRETAANATPQGADHQAILAEVAAEAGRPVSEVRSLILDNTFMRPN